MGALDTVSITILLGSLLVLAGILSSLIALRFGAPLLLVFLLVGMLAGEGGPGHAGGAHQRGGAPDDPSGAAAEDDDRPAVVVGDAGQLGIGVDGDRMADGFEHGEGEPAAEVLAELLQALEQGRGVAEDRVVQGEAEVHEAPEDAVGIRLRDVIGVDNMMWGSDYPHSESTFPQSRKILAEILAGVPEDEQAKIVGANTARLYGFDLARLSPPTCS